VFKAVIFDLGGVIFDSPMQVFAIFEAREGLPNNFLNRLIVAAGHDGAWARLERGEIDLTEFYDDFDREIREAGSRISGRALMDAVTKATRLRPIMIDAVRHIRGQGFKTAALTNNWRSREGDAPKTVALRSEFDVFVESRQVGIAKPDPRIYRLALDELNINADEAIFLDDIGRNLKPARDMGMATIKVVTPEKALYELFGLLKLSFRGAGRQET
jgi:epoxide hydrolase-like predicted phosphatase